MRPVLIAWLAVLATASPTAATELVLTFHDDAEGHFAARGWLEPGSLFQRNAQAAAATWAALIESDAVFHVEVRADPTGLRAGGTFASGESVGVNAAGQFIYEPRPLARVLGRAAPADASDPDIFLTVDPSFVDAFYWLDPTPEERSTPVPPGRTDLVSILLHELGHGLGIAGFRSFEDGPDYGLLTLEFVQLFDEMSYFEGGGQPLDSLGIPNPMFFEGGNAAVLASGDLPLTNVGPRDRLSSQNFYHIGDCDSPVELVTTLMNGCVSPTDGRRMVITHFDVAIMADLGYPIRAAEAESLRRRSQVTPAAAWSGRPHHLSAPAAPRR